MAINDDTSDPTLLTGNIIAIIDVFVTFGEHGRQRNLHDQVNSIEMDATETAIPSKAAYYYSLVPRPFGRGVFSHPPIKQSWHKTIL